MVISIFVKTYRVKYWKIEEEGTATHYTFIDQPCLTLRHPCYIITWLVPSEIITRATTSALFPSTYFKRIKVWITVCVICCYLNQKAHRLPFMSKFVHWLSVSAPPCGPALIVHTVDHLPAGRGRVFVKWQHSKILRGWSLFHWGQLFIPASTHVSCLTCFIWNWEQF